MEMQILNKELTLSIHEDCEFYDFGMIQHTSMKGKAKTIKDKYTATIEKQFLSKDSRGYLYNVEIRDQKHSNTDEVFKTEEVFAFLLQKLVLYTNNHGEISSIVNLNQIKEDWYDQAKSIKQNYKHFVPNIEETIDSLEFLIRNPIEYINFIKKSQIYSLLFPDYYDHNLEHKIEIEQQKVIERFFDTVALPLELKTKLSGFNTITNGFQLIRSGRLDKYHFDKEGASELFSDLYSIHESALNFEASYLETYDLNSNNTTDKANTMLGVKVNDVYQVKEVCNLSKRK